MEVIEGIMSRRSIRNFIKKKVEKKKIDIILEAGRRAPSAGNRQPWRFIVVRDPKSKNKLYNATWKQPWIKDADTLIIVATNPFDSWEHVRYGDVGGDWKNIYLLDVGASIENMLLAAHSLNLGAVWVGAMNKLPVFEVIGEHKKEKKLEIISIIAIGYPDPKKLGKRTSRKNKKDLFFSEKYGNVWR